jgi:hypothetical protein
MEAIPLGNNLNQEAPWVKVNKDERIGIINSRL